MRFEGLDLNLLIALNALLEERSVSSAARRLNVTQPAVTAALNRLRKFFRDDLLAQQGRRMLLTAKAETLMAPVQRTLLQIRSEITRSTTFDPATAERHFVIAASDYAYDILVAGAIVAAASLAPALTFRILPVDERSSELLDQAALDLFITASLNVRRQHSQAHLFDDEAVVISWTGANYGPIDEEIFFAAPHAASILGSDRILSMIEAYRGQRPSPRRAEVVVPSFAALPAAIVGTRRLAFMHHRYADHFARLYPISIHASPVPLPKILQVAQWHRLRDGDAGVQWLLALLKEQAEVIDTSMLARRGSVRRP